MANSLSHAHFFPSHAHFFPFHAHFFPAGEPGSTAFGLTLHVGKWIPDSADALPGKMVPGGTLK